MTIQELIEYKDEEKVEVNGTQLIIQVSMLSDRDYSADVEKVLLETYYSYLAENKKNGFVSRYLEMKIKDVISIFKTSDEIDIRILNAQKR